MDSRALLLAVALSCAVGCNAQDLGLKHIPPVLVEDISLVEMKPQRLEFEFGPSGKYDLRYNMTLRHGPGSSPMTHELRGQIQVRDATGSIRFSKSIVHVVGPNQVGGTLVTINSRNAGVDPHQLVVRWDRSSKEFYDRYADRVTVFLKRRPKFPLTY